MPENDEQLIAAPENTLLVDNLEVLALYAENFGTEVKQPQIHVNFSGRLNNSDQPMTQNVALNIDYAIRMIEIMSSAIASLMIREGMITEEEFNRD